MFPLWARFWDAFCGRKRRLDRPLSGRVLTPKTGTSEVKIRPHFEAGIRPQNEDANLGFIYDYCIGTENAA